MLGDPVHEEEYRNYRISVYRFRDGAYYGEIDNGDGDSGAAEGTFADVESVVEECKRMIDDPYDDIKRGLR